MHSPPAAKSPHENIGWPVQCVTTSAPFAILRKPTRANTRPAPTSFRRPYGRTVARFALCIVFIIRQGIWLLVKKCAAKGAGLQRVQLAPANWFAAPYGNRSRLLLSNEKQFSKKFPCGEPGTSSVEELLST